MQTTITINRDNLHVLIKQCFFRFWDTKPPIFDKEKGTAKVTVIHKDLKDRAMLKVIEQDLAPIIL